MKADFRAVAVGMAGIFLLLVGFIGRTIVVAGQVISDLSLITMDEITQNL